jgi:antirestriction protein ArdC
MISATGADIRLGGDQAFYEPSADAIQLPPKESFDSPADYYSIALHELCHWTGHPSRLNRALTLNRFGDQSYAIEELVKSTVTNFIVSLGALPGRHYEYEIDTPPGPIYLSVYDN